MSMIHFPFSCVYRDAYLKIADIQVNVELGLIAAFIPFIKPLLSSYFDVRKQAEILEAAAVVMILFLYAGW